MPRRLPPLAIAALLALAPPARAVTRLDCDRPGTPYEATELGVPPGPACTPGGPTGSFLRLADTTVANINAVAFDLTDPGPHARIVADFDFRMTPKGSASRADGFGFTLASTAVFGASGPVTGHSEEPDVAGSLGIGFDIHQGPGEVSNNHVSIHMNASRIAEIDVSRLLDLASGEWTHARIIARPGASPPDVTVLLTPCGGAPVTVVDRLPVPGLYPYEARVQLMGRSGGEAALHDLDNLNVQFLDLDQSVVSFGAARVEATEVEGGEAVVTVTRSGNLAQSVSVDYGCSAITAVADADFTPVSGTVTFAKGEETEEIRIPILDDTETEAPEEFLVRLERPSAGATLGGPDQARVAIVDDESARVSGRWSGLLCWPMVAIHATLLPDTRVIMWSRGEGVGVSPTGSHPYLWNRATGAVVPTTDAGYDIFCSGHTLTADGRLLVAGGHVIDEVGLPRASLFDPVKESWTDLPDMNAGRWYPSTVSLANGELLVMSGSIDLDHMNATPQVFSGGAWRTLSNAVKSDDDGAARFYPWLFAAPNGQVFVAGKEQRTWYLDPRGAGAWTHVADSRYGRRDYGSAVMYAPGRVLIVGGNPRTAGVPSSMVPTATAEVIDLNDAAPSWRSIAPMALARRQLNTTLLPDGTVLVTGGTQSPGFNDATSPALTAELWDPATERWTTLAAMRTPRIYHSLAMLLPDGRVLSAGGGYPPSTGGGRNHPDAEIFSPPYLFKGPRPVIASAPARVSYGEAFPIETEGPSGIAAVRWIRLPSVTHSFNESQRGNLLPFTITRAGLYATAPADSNLCPPGHYMLFILNRDGVPSVAKIVQVTRPPGGAPVPGTRGPSLAGARPNPSPRGLVVTYALPDERPAQLAVFDLAGRRVAWRDVSGLGPGEHVWEVGTPRGLTPGVYLIRLTQGGQSVTKKAIVLRP